MNLADYKAERTKYSARWILWYILSLFFFENALPYPSRLKINILRWFGAKVGHGVVIKPNVRIKFPWNLNVGNNVWLGEHVWIDNLAKVVIGNNCCLSQQCYLLTGNHDYNSKSFDLLVSEIHIDDSVWVGARAIVCPGTIMETGSILTVGSVGSKVISSNGIYKGNPAKEFKRRDIK